MSFLPPILGAEPRGVTVARSEGSYPVLESVPLAPVTGRLFRRPRRTADGLPQTTGGSILVFQVNGRFALAPAGPAMLSSDIVTRATMVHLVTVRSHEVDVAALLATLDTRERLRLRTTYQCRVLDPVQVLETGRWDVRSDLRGYLLSDTKTRMLGARLDAATNPEVSQHILARTLARHELEPPTVPGMQVSLIDLALGIEREHASAFPPEHTAGEAVQVDHSPFRPDGTDRPRDRYA